MTESCFSADDFSGQVRLFPIPNLVMFPHVIQPLHVFEPRYRELLAEALDDDCLIALPVLSPGWEADYAGRPPVQPVACLVKVVSHQRQPDGCSNIMTLGLQRIRLTRELPACKSFREASADLLDDIFPEAGQCQRAARQARLVRAFKRKLPCKDQDPNWLDQLLNQDISLAVLTDIVAHTLDLPQECKAQLLSETNVDRRACALLQILGAAQKAAASTGGLPTPFPPRFSDN